MHREARWNKALLAEHTPTEQTMHAHLSELAGDLSVQIRLSFEAALQRAIPDQPLSSSLQEALAARPLMPLVEVHTDWKELCNRIAGLGFEHLVPRLRRDEPLLVLHLPNVLRQYPLRVRNAYRENVLGALEPLYKAGIEDLWKAARTFEDQHNINIHRLNPLGTHEDGIAGYYYLWVLSPRNRPPILSYEELRPPQELFDQE